MTLRGLMWITLAMTTSLTGCATITGEAVPAPEAAQLDTGNYPTEPRTVPTRSGVDAGIQGNILLSDYVIAPPDLDAAFNRKTYVPFSSINDSNSITRMLGDRLAAALLPGNINGMVAPFSEERRTDGIPPAQMATLVLRYLSEGDARAGLSEVRKLAPDSPGSPLPRYPTAYDGPVPTGFGASPTVWFQHKEYIVAATFTDVPDRTRVESLTTAFLDRQLPRLGEVPFRAVDGRTQPSDKDGILRLTMASTTTDRYTAGYFSPRAWSLHSVGPWKKGLDMYATYGVDLIGSEGRNQVLRASNSERAAEYVRRLGDEYAKGESGGLGGRQELSIPNLQGSVCVSRYANVSGTEERIYGCLASRGRYVTMTQASSLRQAQQSAAASWTVLRNPGN